ncbi:hypothetical protein C5167_020752 [Papaver somniferum]|uniref:Uncharacterized protein n=1 Tax=Papaver somniferum TaxID=3469 RepID=A0A4Y7IXV6_PAPSO|nr:hypothetical protein C5167_020752 [Papaver somniferum]
MMRNGKTARKTGGKAPSSYQGYTKTYLMMVLLGFTVDIYCVGIIVYHGLCFGFYDSKSSFLTGDLVKGAGGRKGNGGPKKKSVTRSVRAGLQFPVGRIGRYLKK